MSIFWNYRMYFKYMIFKYLLLSKIQLIGYIYDNEVFKIFVKKVIKNI